MCGAGCNFRPREGVYAVIACPQYSVPLFCFPIFITQSSFVPILGPFTNLWRQPLNIVHSTATWCELYEYILFITVRLNGTQHPEVKWLKCKKCTWLQGRSQRGLDIPAKHQCFPRQFLRNSGVEPSSPIFLSGTPYFCHRHFFTTSFSYK